MKSITSATALCVDTIVSDSRGLAVSKPLPLDRYTIRETKAPANYSANGADITAVLEYSGQIVKFEVTNKSANTGISISKTGPKEAVGGQPVRYVFSKIGNTGNVTLSHPHYGRKKYLEGTAWAFSKENRYAIGISVRPAAAEAASGSV